ncbi:MAG: class I SAM-dependent RNA methyltransferase, partial [Clostridia bacterium]|nr:class I SAM-dependent RNA methyltransferase [Clostridia bacterium]
LVDKTEKPEKNFAKGKLLEIVTESSDRVEAFCTYENECGGCGLQNLAYDAQLALKHKWVQDSLERIGGIKKPLVREIIGMEEPYRYRNKASFPVGRISGEEKKARGCNVGFYGAKSHDVVNCETCLIQAEPAERVAEVIRRYVKGSKLSIYDPKTGTGILRHVIVKTAFGTGEVMVVLVAADRQLPDVDQLVTELSKALELLSEEINEDVKKRNIPDEIPETTEEGSEESTEEPTEDYGFYLESVVLNVNKKKDQRILGRDCITLAGRPTITDYACGLKFEISPLSFYQVNPVQMENMYSKIAEYSGLTGEETILDLYCGVGAPGLLLARNYSALLGLEQDSRAVKLAAINARVNDINYCQYEAGDAVHRLEHLAPLKPASRWLAAGFDESASIPQATDALADPPRAGLSPRALDALMQIAPDRILYISCNPATLARDAAQLRHKYSLERLEAVDLFPHTPHLETVCLLQRD